MKNKNVFIFINIIKLYEIKLCKKLICHIKNNGFAYDRESSYSEIIKQMNQK